MKSIKVKGIDKTYSTIVKEFRDVINKEDLVCLEILNKVGDIDMIEGAVIISKKNWEKLKKL